MPAKGIDGIRRRSDGLRMDASGRDQLPVTSDTRSSPAQGASFTTLPRDEQKMIGVTGFVLSALARSLHSPRSVAGSPTVVTDDLNSNPIGFYQIEEIIRKPLEVNPAKIDREEVEVV